MSIDLLVDPCRELSFRPSDRKESGIDFPNAAYAATSEKWVKRRNGTGVDVGCRLSASVLLLNSDVVEGAITLQRSAERASNSIAVQVRFAHAPFECRSCVEDPIFDEKKCIPMMCVCAGPGDYVDGAARRSSGLSRQTLIYNLELADGFKRKLGTGGAGKFIIVVHAIDINGIAARPQAAKAESAVRQRQCIGRASMIRDCHAWGE